MNSQFKNSQNAFFELSKIIFVSDSQVATNGGLSGVDVANEDHGARLTDWIDLLQLAPVERHLSILVLLHRRRGSLLWKYALPLFSFLYLFNLLLGDFVLLPLSFLLLLNCLLLILLRLWHESNASRRL